MVAVRRPRVTGVAVLGRSQANFTSAKESAKRAGKATKSKAPKSASGARTNDRLGPQESKKLGRSAALSTYK